MDSAMIRVCGSSALIRRVASSPVITGIATSMMITSGCKLAGQLDRLAAVAGLADDLHVLLLGDQGGQAFPHDFVVVDQQDRAEPEDGGRRTEDGAALAFSSVLPHSVLCLLSSGACASGTAIRKMLPLPGTLRILMRPPSRPTRSRMLSSPNPAVRPSVLGSKPCPWSAIVSQSWPLAPLQPQPGLLDPGVLDRVEQDLLARPEEERLDRLGLRVHPAVDFRVDRQAVLGLHLPGQPLEGLAQVALVQDRRAQLVREAPRLLDRVPQHGVELHRDFLHRGIALGPAAQQTQVELRGRKLLLQTVVQDLRHPSSLAVLRLRQLQRELLELVGPMLQLAERRLLLA